MHFFLILGFAILASILGACVTHVEEKGPLAELERDANSVQFDYSSYDCLFGCSTDRPVLEGSEVIVHINNLPKGGRVARLRGDIGVITETGEHCEQKDSTCWVHVTIDAKRAGDGVLGLYDTAGKLLGKRTINVRPAEH